ATTLTSPVEFKVNVVAFSELATVKFMPAVPDVKLAVGALRAPVAVMPLAAPVAFNVNTVATELAVNKVFALLLSLTAAPLLFVLTDRVEALVSTGVPLTPMLAVPAPAAPESVRFTVVAVSVPLDSAMPPV